jgi:hypothetical protein
MVGPAISDGLTNFWHADLDAADVAITGNPAVGESLYWYDDSGTGTVVGEARIYYVSATASGLIMTIDRVTGESPRRAKTFYTSEGSDITVSSSGNTFTRARDLNLSWEDFTGDKFLGSLLNEQAIISNTWDAFKPDPLGVGGVSGVFQLNDDKYAVRDFFCGKFTSGAEEPNLGHEVEVNYGGVVGSFKALVGGYHLTSGHWGDEDAEGVLYLYPNSTTTLDMSLVNNWDYGATITNNNTGNTLGAALPQTGEVQQYENRGLLWKLSAENTTGGWQNVDLGYSMRFDSGDVAPLADLSPLIVTDQVDRIQTTGWQNFSAITQIPDPATGGAADWTGRTNMNSPVDSTYCANVLPTLTYTPTLDLQIPTGIVPGEAKILGLELQFTMHQTAGTDVRWAELRIVNNATGASQYWNLNRGTLDFLNATPGTTYEFGGQLDLFSFDEITQEDLNNGDYSVQIAFYNTGVSSRTINIDMAQVKVHYAQSAQDIYFWDADNSLDRGSASVYSFQVLEGDWSTNDAAGYMTLYDLTETYWTRFTGIEIRTATEGGGDLIAKTKGLEKNYLPSLAEMDDAQSIYQAKKATFSGETDAEAVYVATGASPAFTVDGDGRFSFIRLPIDASKDRPRHVEYHRNHLILATGNHFLVSSIGAPGNFNTGDGATTWNPKDKVTGLAQGANGTTMVACQDSIHLFQGSGATGQDSFRLQAVTDNSGAREYTITNLMNNIYVDSSGLTTVDVSDKYGGFDLGRRAPQAKPLFDDVLRFDRSGSVTGTRLIGAVPVRKKNQYRVYLSDGEILTATFPDDPQQPVSYTRQNYTAYYQEDVKGYEALFAPTSIDSSVNRDGEETVLIGTRAGHVMLVDPNYMDVLSYVNKSTSGSLRRETIQVWKPFKFLDISPIRSGDPSQQIKYLSGEVFLQHEGYAKISRGAFTDYAILPEVPVASNPSLSMGHVAIVGDDTTYLGYLKDDYFSWYIDDATDGLCVRLSKFGGMGAYPVRINSMYLHVQQGGNRKDSIHASHAVTVEEAFLPQDILVVGVTADVAVAGVTGTVTLDVSVTGISAAVEVAGGTGTVSTANPVWKFSSGTITLDSDTDTFDGFN